MGGLPTNRGALIDLVVRGRRPRRSDTGPVRSADFYLREFDVGAGTDKLTCRDCKRTATYEHDQVPPVSSLVNCQGCGLPSRVPVLPSQAGMTNPVDPPPRSERS